MLSKAAIASVLLCLAPTAIASSAQQSYLDKIDALYAGIDGQWNWSITVLSPEQKILERSTARETISYDRERHAASSTTVMQTAEGTISSTGTLVYLSEDELEYQLQQGAQTLVSGRMANTVAVRDNHLSVYIPLGELGIENEMMMNKYRCEELYRHVVVLENRILTHDDCLQDGQPTVTIISEGERAQASK